MLGAGAVLDQVHEVDQRPERWNTDHCFFGRIGPGEGLIEVIPRIIPAVIAAIPPGLFAFILLRPEYG